MFKSNRVFQNVLRSYSVRVRFAPSPTGHLHLGGLRTALYNFLFARKHGGKFVLRIEDTDQTRLVEGASNQLQDDLNWCGIEIDEGPNVGGHFGPYIQSERKEIYNEQIKVLLQSGAAYKCFCTDKRLDLLRREAVKARQVPKYDNRCRRLSEEVVMKRVNRGDKYCVRFKLLPDCETFEDLIYGNICYDVALIEGDPVIMKSDGFPTYHFANVVDDHFMQISHVLRGVEWQVSTTKHILMYRAFNWEPPQYGHLPLLMNADGTKLSKRQGDIHISYYRNSGIFPQALINFITHSGGGFTKDHERGLKPRIYTTNQLMEQFDVSEINSHSGRLMSERLLEFNRLELKRQLNDENKRKILVQTVRDMVKSELPGRDETSLQINDTHITSILIWSLNRIEKLSDLVSKDLMFLWVIPDIDINDIDNEHKEIVQKLSAEFKNENLLKEELNVYFRKFASDNKIAFNKFMKLMRMILSGLKEGPSVAEMVEILGHENTQLRLKSFLQKK